MSGMGDRWNHVQAAGRAAASLNGVSQMVVTAAWLHDIGYADTVRSTGLHQLDGAQHLVSLRAPVEIVSLVAYHTSAIYEAEERGLDNQLRATFEPPRNEQDRDLLAFVDLTTGPTGRRVRVGERIDEILTRYPSDSAVHRGVSRATPELFASCERVVTAFGLSDEWLGALPSLPLQKVVDP
jgi:hypothetical protein